jgi:hypothetical protein
MSLPTIQMLSMRIKTLERQLTLLLDEQKVDIKEKKKKKEKKSQNESSSLDEDEDKTKRGPNGYILFCHANRDEVTALGTFGDKKPKNTDIMKQLAQMWQNCDAEEKAMWNAKAKEANLGRGRKTKHIKKSHKKITRARRHLIRY